MPRLPWRRALSVVCAAALLVAACLPTGPAVADAVAIHVHSNDWHTEIVIPRAALPDGALPEAVDFPGAAYLSFGWGDANYFPAPDPGLGVTLSAALRPTPALLLVTGLTVHPRDAYPRGEVVELQVTAGGFARLVAYLDASFERAGAPRAWASQPGRHRFSLFYKATGKFHLFNTCNTWTARGLAAAGLPVEASGVMTAEDLMTQLRR